MRKHGRASPGPSHHPQYHTPRTNGLPAPSSSSAAANTVGVPQLVSPAPNMAPPPPPPPAAATATPRPAAMPSKPESLIRLAKANEETWMAIGTLAERMSDADGALAAYENALRHNPKSIDALSRVAVIARSRDDLAKAVSHWQRVLELQGDNGEIWGAMGHCFLMQDDLQKAYTAYQQALYFLPNPKDPKLWYGIGILYDRYGSLEHAEEAFSSVLKMDSNFEKADEIHFRLGIIYKQQQKYTESLECFERILRSPPSPLANVDIWFQIGHVYEQQKDYLNAKDAYERVLSDSPNHSKVLQQLGWLYHQSGSSFANQDLAIQYLTRSLESDSSDAQSWYLLGRAYMAGQKYQKAYEAYQQAVYRDGRNPTFWCSIGVLYYNINQYRDALDAYSRAIRINPYISEVWFDLGSLYESCNNQISDAIDAYARAADLDSSNILIRERLMLLRDAQRNGGTVPPAPGPQDVHPTAYATVGPPTLLTGHATSRSYPNGPQHPGGPPMHDNALALNGRDLPAPNHGNSPPYGRPDGNDPLPFHGGPPPPLNLDDNKDHQQRGRPHYAQPPPSHHRSGSVQHSGPGPMDIDRPSYPPSTIPPVRPGSTSSVGGPSSLLLQHPVPQPQMSVDQMQQRTGQGGRSHHSSNGASHVLPPMSASRSHSHGRRLSSESGGRSSPPPHTRRPASPPINTRNGGGQFSQNLPPPPSTHVNVNNGAPPGYFGQPPYSNGSNTPGERERDRDRMDWDMPQRKRDRGAPTSPSIMNRGPPGTSSSYYTLGYDGRRGGSPPPPHQRDPRDRDERYRERTPGSTMTSPSASYNGPNGKHDSRRGEASSPYSDDRIRQQYAQQQQQHLPPPSGPSKRYDPRLDHGPPPSQGRRSDSNYERDPRMHQESPYPDRRYSATPDHHAERGHRAARHHDMSESPVPASRPQQAQIQPPHPQQPIVAPVPAAEQLPPAPPPKERKRRGAPKEPKEEKPPKEKKERKTAAKKAKEAAAAAAAQGGNEMERATPAPTPTPTGRRAGRGAATNAMQVSPQPARTRRDVETGSTSSRRSTQSTVTTSQSPHGIMPRREVDEDYDEGAGAAEALVGLARAPVQQTVALTPSPAPTTSRNSLASLLSNPNPPTSQHAQSHRPPSPKPEYHRQPAPAERSSTPLSAGKRPRTSSVHSTDAPPMSKRTRIEILNTPSTVSLSPPAPAPGPDPPVVSQSAKRLSPIPMASRAPSAHFRSNSRMRSRSSSPQRRAPEGEPSQSRVPSPPSGPLAVAPAAPVSIAALESAAAADSHHHHQTPPPSKPASRDNNPPLPSIATLSPPPPSPPKTSSQQLQAPDRTRSRSEAASDMLLDSDVSRSGSTTTVKDAGASAVAPRAHSPSRPPSSGDRMAVDSPAPTTTTATTEAALAAA